MAATDPTPSRRAVLGAAAWAAPVVVVATSAPAHAASGATSLVPTTPGTTVFSEDTAASRTVAATLLDGTTPVTGRGVTFTVTGSWLRLPAGSTSAAVTTTGDGLAATTLTAVPGAAPTAGDQVVLVARYQDLQVTWTITYRPFTGLPTGGFASHQVVLADGRAYGWGFNGGGQVGDGGTSDRLVPVATQPGAVPSGVALTGVAVGGAHTAAIGSDGSAYAWGLNGNGQLGDGTTGSHATPVAVQRGALPTGATVTAVAAGEIHTAALGSDGKVYTWGTNQRGQLGDGTLRTTRLLPVAALAGAIPADVRITAVVAGRYHTVALGSDGKVYTWGANESGQLGDGASANRLEPVAVLPGAVPAGVRITAVAAGTSHTLALGSDAKVYAWGSGSALGTGSSTSSRTPVATVAGEIPDGVGITAIAAGEGFSVALGSNGRVYAWGRNTEGQLGNGTATFSASPTAVVPGAMAAGARVVAVSAVIHNAYALTEDRLVYAWGSALRGGLGNGTGSGVATSPVKVTVAP